MDISTMIPLLTNSNPNLDIGKINLIKTILEGKKLEPSELLSMMPNHGGDTSQLASMMAIINNSKQHNHTSGNNKNNKAKQKSPRGLKPLGAIAPDIILGRLVKFFGV